MSQEYSIICIMYTLKQNLRLKKKNVIPHATMTFLHYNLENRHNVT